MTTLKIYDETLVIKLPATITSSENYPVILTDADGTVHFWKPGAIYDGHDRVCKECPDGPKKDREG